MITLTILAILVVMAILGSISMVALSPVIIAPVVCVGLVLLDVKLLKAIFGRKSSKKEDKDP